MPKFCIKILFGLVFSFFLPLLAFTQLLTNKSTYTKYDSLLGSISKYRDYDVKHYNLDIKVDLSKRTIKGNCLMSFHSKNTMDTIQVDLFEFYKIQDIKINNTSCNYFRDKNHIFIIAKNLVKKQMNYQLEISYEGMPIQAKRAPWDGGFVWKKDSFGDEFVGVACEGLGASSWWPCKDHWSDEPDSGMSISIAVPKDYKAISNGKLMKTMVNNDQSTWVWKVINPINLYDVTLNIAKYEKIEEDFKSKETGKTLKMTYWVLRENLEKAVEHFKQVKPMMECYESKLGSYPFYEDGYQLVETSYLGMEHQSCVAYGNKYRNGYLGDLKMTGGHKFDYIIIHETGHEWFGNNITAADNADMWIHEALTTYSESIYAECMYGAQAGMDYINKMKPRVGNKHAIQGEYGVAKEGAGDMYAKGALFFHTLRYQINDEKLWYEILKDINREFGKKTTDYKSIVNFFNQKSKRKFDDLFSAYLQTPVIPMLKVVESNTKNNKKMISIQLEHTKLKSFRVFYKVNGKEYQAIIKENLPLKLQMPMQAKFELNQDKGYYKVVY